MPLATMFTVTVIAVTGDEILGESSSVVVTSPDAGTGGRWFMYAHTYMHMYMHMYMHIIICIYCSVCNSCIVTCTKY